MKIRELDCCGGKELIGINDIEWTAEKYLLCYVDGSCVRATKGGSGFVVMSYAYDTVVKHGGYRSRRQGTARVHAFAKLIEDNKLGEIYISKAVYNPNYGKRVKLIPMMWFPNNNAIYKYVTKNCGRVPGKQRFNGLDW